MLSLEWAQLESIFGPGLPQLSYEYMWVGVLERGVTKRQGVFLEL